MMRRAVLACLMALTGGDRVVGLDRGDPPPPEWMAIAAGSAHTCGTKLDISLWCWGENTTGQVGDGTAWSPAFVAIAP